MTDTVNRGGRPPLPRDNARSCRVRVYLTPPERDLVAEDAKRLGISMSEVLQRAWSRRCPACAGVSGALVDAGGIVPDHPAEHAAAVRALAAECDELRALVRRYTPAP